MTKKKFGPAAAALIAGILLVGRASAEPLALRSGRLWLEGDSTLHPFASTATSVNISGEAAGPLPESIGKGGVAKLEVSIPVKGLKSGEPRLDRNLYAALTAEKFPQITFRLSHYAVLPSSSSDQSQTVHADGALSIAGTEKPVTLEALVSPSAGAMRVRGRKELLMTDFGVKPPKLFLGALKVRDRVVVFFDLTLGLEKQ
jgi:hypothetical protein